MGLNIVKETTSQVDSTYVNFSSLGNVKVNKDDETITLTVCPSLYVSEDTKDDGATAIEADTSRSITLSGDYYDSFMEGCYAELKTALEDDGTYGDDITDALDEDDDDTTTDDE